MEEKALETKPSEGETIGSFTHTTFIYPHGKCVSVIKRMAMYCQPDVIVTPVESPSLAGPQESEFINAQLAMRLEMIVPSVRLSSGGNQGAENSLMKNICDILHKCEDKKCGTVEFAITPVGGWDIESFVKVFLNAINDFFSKSQETSARKVYLCASDVDIFARIKCAVVDILQPFIKGHTKTRDAYLVEIEADKENREKDSSEENKPQGKWFSRHLQDITTTENPIPNPVIHLLRILFKEGPHELGILRISPSERLLKEICSKMDNGDECLNELNPVLAAGLLKRFLKSIPDNLMYDDLLAGWEAIHNPSDEQEKFEKIKRILEKLPPCYFALLQHLVCVLFYIDKRSDENQMSATNLAVCIAPSLLREELKGNPKAIATAITITTFMIRNFVHLFGEQSLNIFA